MCQFDVWTVKFKKSRNAGNDCTLFQVEESKSIISFILTSRYIFFEKSFTKYT